MKRNLNKQITLIFETLLTRLSIHIGLPCSAKNHLNSRVLPGKVSHTQLVSEAYYSEEISPAKSLWRKYSLVPGTPRTLSQETRLNLSCGIWHPTGDPTAMWQLPPESLAILPHCPLHRGIGPCLRCSHL